MRTCKIMLAVWLTAPLWPWQSGRAAEPAADGAASAPPAVQAPQRCLEAVVNPVSGHAECVRPRGVAVEPPAPPARPPSTPPHQERASHDSGTAQ